MSIATACTFTLALALTLPASAAAQAVGGFYIGIEDIGLVVPSGLESTRTNVGIPTNCDQWLAPAVLNDGTTVPLPLDQCAPRALPARPNDFSLNASWVAAGLTAGYSTELIRLEVEYFFRFHNGDTLSLDVPGDPKQREFVERSESIDSLIGHNLFVNAYRDLIGLAWSRAVPFVGAGIGWTRTRLYYSGASIRTGDHDTLLDLGRNPNAAGTTTRADATPTDSLPGYQLLAGVDYAVNERLALTFKVRYAGAIGDLEVTGVPWVILRDHESTVGPGGAPIHYDINARNLGLWSISTGVKFGF
jgi:opacity protein-like surface antigen